MNNQKSQGTTQDVDRSGRTPCYPSSIRHVAFNDDGDTAESRLKVTRFLVEATGNEWHTLWARWCGKSQECREPIVDEWEQLGGWGICIGKLDSRPVVVSLNWDRLDGFLVCQWEATSEVVDYKMVNEWLDRHFSGETRDGRRARCNAMNFHHCAGEFEDWKKRDG